MPSSRPRVYQFKITIQRVQPPVWRRLVVPWEFTLELVHEYLQSVFGWTNTHLHHFVIDGKRYGTPSEELDLEFDGDERTIKLRHIVTEGDTFEYEYDFGDCWHHRIVVEKLFEPLPQDILPACTGGARACPPEDCGGADGYADLLRALKKPGKSRDARSNDNWPDIFDPEAFDLAETNRIMHGK